MVSPWHDQPCRFTLVCCEDFDFETNEQCAGHRGHAALLICPVQVSVAAAGFCNLEHSLEIRRVQE
eukprot:6736912-Prymnesium_polylepis.1